MSRPPFVEKLTLKSFRSIRDEAVNFDNPTILVGRNGAGKSNFVDAVAFLSECMSTPLPAVFERRGGSWAVLTRMPSRRFVETLGMRADFRLPDGNARSGHYAFLVREVGANGYVVQREQVVVSSPIGERVWFDRKLADFRTNIVGLRPDVEPQSLALPVVGGTEQLAPLRRAFASMRVHAIDPDWIRERQDPDSGLALKHDGSNVASVLERVSEVLSSVASGIIRVRPIAHGKQLALEFGQQWGPRRTVSFEATAMSDGTLRALGILVAVMQQPAPSVIVLEEPEITIHPGALGTIMDLIQIAAQRSQVVITTHSPELLDAAWIRAENLRLVQWESGATFISPLGTGAVAALQQHLMGAGELFRSNALETDPAVEPGPVPSLFDRNFA